jgi:hypothetical protein
MITDLKFDSVDSSMRSAARDANTVGSAKPQNAAQAMNC